jgi:HD-GYP domain-containing protein (c-di-GMP phosphodiesterase class II)
MLRGIGARSRRRSRGQRLRDAEKSLSQLEQAYELTVEALAAALELRDDETGSHARRVTDIALRLTRAVDPALADEPELRRGFLLHDIGKIGIPDTILLKPGPLDAHELRVLEMHTTLGEQLVSTIPYLSGLARQVIAYHHERWDGHGYPWRLSGTDIPLPARIFAIADAYDAMTTDRPYRKAMSVEQAIEEIDRSAGSQFDPDISAAFIPVASRLNAPSDFAVGRYALDAASDVFPASRQTVNRVQADSTT